MLDLGNYKNCIGCKTEKIKTEFGLNNAKKDKLSPRCKPCLRAQKRDYRAARPGIEKTYWPKHYLKYRENKLQKSNEQRRRKIQATPSWIRPKLDFIFLKEIAKNCSKKIGKRVVTDHVIPFTHPGICGLNVPWNIQILTAEENLKKSNSFDYSYQNSSWKNEKGEG